VAARHGGFLHIVAHAAVAYYRYFHFFLVLASCERRSSLLMVRGMLSEVNISSAPPARVKAQASRVTAPL